MRYLGIDVGSSFIKAALLDTSNQQVMDITKQPTPKRIPNDNMNIYEVNVRSIVDCVKSMIIEHISKRGPVAGILFSTQMHGFVLCDEAGEPVTNYISWQDTRGMNP
ncbi:hypothetical protein GC096_18715 [Paenibacillus sp. LMG 31461]|uniref:Carbohydrate kinase FGGY N-terminal domain-containing protein n=1 Tax=Paenibacillus plantarum TaxID=2654975 RepID=A0ABX1XC92_9BACL|nr:hypothetical protein [Paenibacillus plantarum]